MSTPAMRERVLRAIEQSHLQEGAEVLCDECAKPLRVERKGHPEIAAATLVSCPCGKHTTSFRRI